MASEYGGPVSDLDSDLDPQYMVMELDNVETTELGPAHQGTSDDFRSRTGPPAGAQSLH